MLFGDALKNVNISSLPIFDELFKTARIVQINLLINIENIFQHI